MRASRACRSGCRARAGTSWPRSTAATRPAARSPRAALARAAGFDHVSLDLIYGTPGETPADWEASLRAALSAGVDHLSAYGLTVEPGTRLHARVRAGAPAPRDDVLADRYRAADSVLGDAGMRWYEISNWAATDAARCRHNLGYWRSGDWWGVGPGARIRTSAACAGGTSCTRARTRPGSPPALAGGGARAARAAERRTERIMLEVRLAEGLALGGDDPRAAAAAAARGASRAPGRRRARRRPRGPDPRRAPARRRGGAGARRLTRPARTAGASMQAMPSDAAVERVIADTRRICEMPAPPFAEGPRAELVAYLFGEIGTPHRIDAIGNVLAAPTGAEGPGAVVFAAHLDTVFAEGTEIVCEESGGRLSAPGCRGQLGRGRRAAAPRPPPPRPSARPPRRPRRDRRRGGPRRPARREGAARGARRGGVRRDRGPDARGDPHGRRRLDPAAAHGPRPGRAPVGRPRHPERGPRPRRPALGRPGRGPRRRRRGERRGGRGRDRDQRDRGRGDGADRPPRRGRRRPARHRGADRGGPGLGAGRARGRRAGARAPPRRPDRRRPPAARRRAPRPRDGRAAAGRGGRVVDRRERRLRPRDPRDHGRRDDRRQRPPARRVHRPRADRRRASPRSRRWRTS